MNLSNFPKFKYHPNFYHSQMLVWGDQVCNCCKQKVAAYVESMYAIEDIDCICINCIADGSAAAMFDGTFIQDADPVSNPEAVEELLHHTPGYFSWQGENWKACCNDYCAFVTDIDRDDLYDPAFQKKLRSGEIICDTDLNVQDIINGAGYIRGYLFQCLHCSKLYMRIDMD